MLLIDVYTLTYLYMLGLLAEIFMDCRTHSTNSQISLMS